MIGLTHPYRELSLTKFFPYLLFFIGGYFFIEMALRLCKNKKICLGSLKGGVIICIITIIQILSLQIVFVTD